MKAVPAPCSFSNGVVILAAGRSRRMGRPKLLLPWGDSSVLGHLVAQWQGLGALEVSVVCALDDTGLAAELDRVGFPAEQRIFNPAPDRGMFSSIQCAALWPGWRDALTHWTLVLGDQPHLRERTLRRVLEFSAAHAGAVCQPAQGGHRRHPVVLPKEVFKQLASSTATDLKEFLKPLATAVCELDDDGLGLDIDRPEDYEQAKWVYFGEG
jgi:molybdenum cofactor cytidylyltransferase